MKKTVLMATVGLGIFIAGRVSMGFGPTTEPVEAMVVNTTVRNMTGDRRPAWSHITGAGTLKAVNSGHFDRHYHDCNEYWMIVHGKAKVWCDGKTFYVHDGDIFCIPRGKLHDILELYEPIQGFYMEDEVVPGGKAGHLHVSEADAKGHDVPMLAVPGDFPKD